MNEEIKSTTKKADTPPNQAVNELIGFLTPLAEGTLVPDFNIALRNVVRGVRDTGKDGSIALKLKIEPAKGSKSQLIVRASIEEKTPQPPRPMNIFFDDEDGGLHRSDPRQMGFNFESK